MIALRDSMGMLIIALTIIGVALGSLPGLKMDRTSIAITGAVLLVATGFMPLAAAYASIDLNTLVLLFALMVVNAHLRMTGFFSRFAAWLTPYGRSSHGLLLMIMMTAALFSALFLNDTIALAFTPLVIAITRTGRRNPLPYLVGLGTACNIGSVATLIGNPQNILIGVASHIRFVDFSRALLPVALFGLALAYALIALIYRRELRTVGPGGDLNPDSEMPASGGNSSKVLFATLLMLALMLSGTEPSLAALIAAALLLISRSAGPEQVFRHVDWPLLIFFGGLFVVTGAIAYTPLNDPLRAYAGAVLNAGVWSFTAAAAVVSNLVSNVPAVLLFRPLMTHAEHPQLAWLTLAMASTLAGNLSLLGSIANLIVAESARREGVHVGFGEFLKAGVPVTLATLAAGAAWLQVSA